MHLADPIAQAVEDQAPDDRFIGVQRVAAAGVVGVAGFVLRKDVIGFVCQSAEADGGTVFVALGGVVVDDIGDDLDSRAMQRLDHVAKLVERAKRVGSGAVAVMRREKRQGLVPPIVAEALRSVLLVEGKDRQQLDGADPEVLQVGNLVDQPGVGAALARSDA